MDKRLLDILVCPLCKGPLYWQQAEQELVCKVDRLAYVVKDDVPVMLPEEARPLADSEFID